MLEIIKEILTARESGGGYFGGAEGAIRFVLLMVFLALCGIGWLFL